MLCALFYSFPEGWGLNLLPTNNNQNNNQNQGEWDKMAHVHNSPNLWEMHIQNKSKKLSINGR